MKRGRPIEGAKLVDRVEGSEQAKQRLRIILQTLSGELTVPQACASLNISEARFHELRNGWMQDSCAALEPKPLGRPKETTPEQEQALLKLHRENQMLEIHLRAAQIRTEIALVAPHLLDRTLLPPIESEKKEN